MRCVIDASVATKWLLPEVDSSSALAVLDAAQTGRIALIAPALITEVEDVRLITADVGLIAAGGSPDQRIVHMNAVSL